MTTGERTDLYRFYDRQGRLLYVGISLSAAQRASQHRAEKAWWPDVARMDVEHHPTRADASAAELRAIKTERPLHNIAGAVDGPPQPPAPVAPQDTLVGWYVLTGDDPNFHRHQGYVTATVTPTVYLIQWFSWLNGCPTNASVVPVDRMEGWRFYDSIDDWHAAGERQMAATDREMDRMFTS